MIALRELFRAVSVTGWAVMAALLMALLLLATCARHSASEAKRTARDAEARAKQVEQARKADAAASDQKRIDEIIIHQKEKELTYAVKGFEDTKPSPARRALNCQRLRQQSGNAAAASAGCPTQQ